MKKLIFILILIIIAAWIGYSFFYKDKAGLNLEKTAKACTLNDWNWLGEYRECEYAEKEWCLESRGEYNECSSACRHNPDPFAVCTLECIPVCKF